jgi:hypothetical protein
MLKIQRSLDGDLITLALSGRIDDESLLQLETMIQAEERRLAIDLKEVTLVGREAVRFLAKCEGAGATIQNCPAYVREWISQERRTR